MTNTDRKIKYELKLAELGFTRIQVVTHKDDRAKLLEAARLLREARWNKERV